ncbi:hypothetical protein CBOM_04183 [Ceraceosorus bombacis]|uniref:Uncharacterized protein n=1 Tax=Ceraceosorus bombacis TaxID=401625 RepID=A0A0P1BN88_9BASI|nr:hypothetical protein CBOM_04183 [Ceraceosorus bombacis]
MGSDAARVVLFHDRHSNVTERHYTGGSNAINIAQIRTGEINVSRMAENLRRSTYKALADSNFARQFVAAIIGRDFTPIGGQKHGRIGQSQEGQEQVHGSQRHREQALGLAKLT